MIQGSLIQQSIRDGSLVLYHDYRLQHARDLSSYGNNGTLQGTAKFQRDGVYFRALAANTGVSVPYSVSFPAATETCIALFASSFSFVRLPGSALHVIMLRFVNGADFRGMRLIMGAPGTSIFLDNPVLGTTIISPRSNTGTLCFGVDWASNAGALFYKDGVFTGSSAVAQLAYPAATTLFIGGASTLIPNRGVGGCMSAFMLFNRRLTATEHARVYGELMKR